jgi:hypothetical protein
MTGDVELACRLVEAVQAQNTRAGKARTYHLVISLHPKDRSLDRRELRRVVEHLVDVLGFSEHQYITARHNDKDHEHIHVAINKIHPETFRMHSPAWDHQKLFTAGRVLEMELGLTPLRTVARERENLPERAADCEAHQGIDSFARWARKTLAPALRATELRSWDDLHSVSGRYGVVVRLHGNGLVFEDAEQGIRVKASCVGRNFSKARLCKQLGDFRPAPGHQLEDAGRMVQRYSPMPAMVPSRRRFDTSDGFSAPYPCRTETENAFHNNWHSAKPSNPGPSDESSQFNGRRFRSRRTLTVGVISFPAAPRTATPERFDFCSDESSSEVRTTLREDASNYGRSVAALGRVDITSWYRAIRR